MFFSRRVHATVDFLLQGSRGSPGLPGPCGKPGPQVNLTYLNANSPKEKQQMYTKEKFDLRNVS